MATARSRTEPVVERTSKPEAAGSAGRGRTSIPHLGSAGELPAALPAELRATLDASGAAVVGDVPAESDEALLALNSILGTPSAVGNGDGVIHDVRPRAVGKQRDLSTTRKPFPLHTDSTAMARPHDYVCLACVSAPADGGGESMVIGLEEIEAGLSAQARATLAQPLFPFPLNDPAHGQGVRWAPVLDDGTIRYRSDVLELGELVSGTDMDEAARSSLEELDGVLADERRRLVRALRPGDVLFVDNRRALHGRTEITAEADRHMRRIKVYADG